MTIDTGDGAGRRTLGLGPATGIGVGAIVGGGVLALSGVAFATTGPGAIVAFGLNGVIALLTALSFAELAARFPRSGGAYAYARSLTSIDAAFAVGWVVWFASVVAAVLYAMGFAVFFVPVLEQVARAFGGRAPAWLGSRFALVAYAIGALALYARHLTVSEPGSGQWASVGKMAVFAVLILAGIGVFVADPPSLSQLQQRFTPFFEHGATGLVQAMGYTFIALQGFDLIAAVGGEVRQPERNIPRAMLLSLGIALAVYIPLLTLVVAVGSGGEPIRVLAERDPEILLANAAQNFLGPLGYWLVIVAGVLSMLSALQANLTAASSLARTMASDRTLPTAFGDRAGTQASAVKLTAITIAGVLVAVPNVASAGAASSLIFLWTFAIVHWMAYRARVRSVSASPFSVPLFPLVPALGGAACLLLGLFQALAVPSAGALAALWLSAGAVLFAMHLAPRAKAVDALAEGRDPNLMQLRGRSPLVLVPIANPANARSMVHLTAAVAPAGISRVQLLSVLPTVHRVRDDTGISPLVDAQKVLGDSLETALESDLRPEVMIALSDDPFREITRRAVSLRCEMVVMGVGGLDESLIRGPLDRLISSVDADVVVLRAPPGWDPTTATRIVVPSRLGRAHSPTRARLLGNLLRTAPRAITFLGVQPTTTPAPAVARAEQTLRRIARDEAPGSEVALVRGDDVVAEIARWSEDCDLLILGLQRGAAGRGTQPSSAFGRKTLEIARAASCPLLMISGQV